MRIVEPKKAADEPAITKKRRSKVPLLVFALFMSAGALAFFVMIQPEEIAVDQPSQTFQTANESSEQPQQSVASIQRTGELRIFTDNEFNVFYNNLLQPDLERVENPPSITGDDIADTRIRNIAEQRGYRLRASPSIEANLVSVDGYQLHAIVDDSWESMQAAAAQAGHSMSIVSGYRSVDSQRLIFTQRLSAAGASTNEVAAGIADEIVNEVLIQSSIPGYSKHHTAYTIDLACAGFVFENFGNSPCFDWLAANNYENAKEYGFIPSYPPEADAQGPDPEAWEYVYVGRDLLTQ